MPRSVRMIADEQHQSYMKNSSSVNPYVLTLCESNKNVTPMYVLTSIALKTGAYPPVVLALKRNPCPCETLDFHLYELIAVKVVLHTIRTQTTIRKKSRSTFLSFFTASILFEVRPPELRSVVTVAADLRSG